MKALDRDSKELNVGDSVIYWITTAVDKTKEQNHLAQIKQIFANGDVYATPIGFVAENAPDIWQPGSTLERHDGLAFMFTTRLINEGG